MWVFVLVTAIILLIVVYFRVPFSPVKSDFEKAVSTQMPDTKTSEELFTTEEIENLPLPVKRYFETCGYIGTPKMGYMKAVHKDVDFLLSADKPYTKIDYTQYTFASEPARLAFMCGASCRKFWRFSKTRCRS